MSPPDKIAKRVLVVDETAFREGITAITIERSTRTYPGTLSALQLDKAEVNFVAQ